MPGVQCPVLDSFPCFLFEFVFFQFFDFVCSWKTYTVWWWFSTVQPIACAMCIVIFYFIIVILHLRSRFLPKSMKIIIIINATMCTRNNRNQNKRRKNEKKPNGLNQKMNCQPNHRPNEIQNEKKTIHTSNFVAFYRRNSFHISFGFSFIPFFGSNWMSNWIQRSLFFIVVSQF